MDQSSNHHLAAAVCYYRSSLKPYLSRRQYVLLCCGSLRRLSRSLLELDKSSASISAIPDCIPACQTRIHECHNDSSSMLPLKSVHCLKGFAIKNYTYWGSLINENDTKHYTAPALGVMWLFPQAINITSLGESSEANNSAPWLWLCNSSLIKA